MYNINQTSRYYNIILFDIHCYAPLTFKLYYGYCKLHVNNANIIYFHYKIRVLFNMILKKLYNTIPI